MSEPIKDNKNNSFENFLTAEEKFKLEFEKYFPELLQRAADDTMHEDNFDEYTQHMMTLGEEAGIDLKTYSLTKLKEIETKN